MFEEIKVGDVLQQLNRTKFRRIRHSYRRLQWWKGFHPHVSFICWILVCRKEKIELWHHSIDGEPGSESFMDWPITESYCKNFAEAFNVPSISVGGWRFQTRTVEGKRNGRLPLVGKTLMDLSVLPSKKGKSLPEGSFHRYHQTSEFGGLTVSSKLM